MDWIVPPPCLKVVYLESLIVTLLEKGVFADIIKDFAVRSSWIKEGLNTMTGVLIWEKAEGDQTETHRRRPYEDREGYWNDAATRN